MLFLPHRLSLSSPGVFPPRVRNWLRGGLWLILGAQFCPLRAGVVQGHSMKPALAPGSLFVYDHTYYQHHPVRSGDVVLIREGGGIWVKRVYAAGGESFWTLRERMPGGRFRRDPIAPGQEGRFARFAAHRRRRHQDLKVVRLRLPAGQLFLVGDHAWSQDSRSVGPLARADVVGRVIELPGQRLSTVPDYIALSFPQSAARIGGPAPDPLTGDTHRTSCPGLTPSVLEGARTEEAAGV
jgi:signal peptidase I